MRIASLNPWSRIGSSWSRSYRFLEKKNIPGQVEHPVEEEPRGILKRGNRSKRGNPKPKRVYFWDESPPILKVLRVQDHNGPVAQLHSYEKEEPIPKTILGDGQEKHWGLGLWPGPDRKEHRAAEVVPRSHGKVHRWLEKKINKTQGKRSLAAGGKDQYREKLISCWTQRTPLGALRGQRW